MAQKTPDISTTSFPILSELFSMTFPFIVADILKVSLEEMLDVIGIFSKQFVEKSTDEQKRILHELLLLVVFVSVEAMNDRKISEENINSCLKKLSEFIADDAETSPYVDSSMAKDLANRNSVLSPTWATFAYLCARLSDLEQRVKNPLPIISYWEVRRPGVSRSMICLASPLLVIRPEVMGGPASEAVPLMLTRAKRLNDILENCKLMFIKKMEITGRLQSKSSEIIRGGGSNFTRAHFLIFVAVLLLNIVIFLSIR